MYNKKIIAALVMALGLSGCHSTNTSLNESYPQTLNETAKGATIGAVGGAALGGTVGGLPGLPVGALLGGVAGGAVGNSLPEPTQYAQMLNLGVQVITEGQSVKVVIPTDKFFGQGSAGFEPKFYPVLDTIITMMHNYNIEIIKVAGFTNKTDNAVRDKALSQQRAQEIADYLTWHDAGARLVYAVGYGDKYPVSSNKTATGQRENRRVEITFMQATTPLA